MTRSMRLGLFILLIISTALITSAIRGGLRSSADVVWGKRGVLDGDFVRPRAATIIGDRIYIVDFTARIQAFSLDGEYAGITFTTPDFRNGRPSGLGTDRDGNLIVCDSHYHMLRIYSPSGVELRQFGGTAGSAVGEFGYLSDCVQDGEGFYYLSEFGQNDRITKLDREGQVVTTWGVNGTGPGEFQRIRALALGPDGLIYVADACNHRIQVFDRDGGFVRSFGGPGREAGAFSYPYDLAFDPSGNLYVVERGNARIQQLTPEGQSLRSWGMPGSEPGQLADPWALAIDRQGRIHIIDTENHRVQRISF